ncbi:uncharacterized protein LOC120631997 [Pararge aegeria]|uniref:Jg19544 protein n=1 Tax=Pararge aegeria aegeria TaxID=348720 RepID=A0A8S4R812_9NEOP|nr:uncharacterized protein LOC120631997 [Pararge aegeria]CAH2230638.1 jg19544 [Pararge aegeria aegeria]
MNLIYTKTLLLLMSYAAAGTEVSQNDLNEVLDQAGGVEINKSCELHDNMAGSDYKSLELRTRSLVDPQSKTEGASSTVLEYLKNLTTRFCVNTQKLSKEDLEKLQNERLKEMIKCVQALTCIFIMVFIRKIIVPALARDLSITLPQEAERPNSDDDADNQEIAEDNAEG